jgi:hypothetical protein
MMSAGCKFKFLRKWLTSCKFFPHILKTLQQSIGWRCFKIARFGFCKKQSQNWDRFWHEFVRLQCYLKPLFLQLTAHVSASCRELSSSATLHCCNLTYCCHTFPPKNTFGHQTSAFYCVILLHVLMKIVNVPKCPLRFRGAPGWNSF